VSEQEPQPFEELSLRRLLVAVDGSPSGDLALRAALTVARRDRATITLLTVAPDLAADLSRWALAAGVAPTSQDEVDREGERMLREAAALVPDDISVCTLLRRGKAGPEIVAQATEGDYDAIVLGARGVSRVGALIGSVSQYVLHHAPIAVFVAHQPRDDGSPTDRSARRG
jgi:nucleotide-binding universal stress UspA family protein